MKTKKPIRALFTRNGVDIYDSESWLLGITDNDALWLIRELLRLQPRIIARIKRETPPATRTGFKSCRVA